MRYSINLPTRPFKAIKSGTKKIEGRRQEDVTDNGRLIQTGDTIIFTNQDDGEVLQATVAFVHNYNDVRSMLETEGTENVLSSRGTIEDGIKNYNEFSGYPESIAKNGIYAMGLERVLSNNES